LDIKIEGQINEGHGKLWLWMHTYMGGFFFLGVQVKLVFVVMEFVNDNFMCWGVKCMGPLGHWWKIPTNTLSLMYFGHLKKVFANILNQMSRPVVKDPQTLQTKWLANTIK
jgi:hypothetical protein